MGLLNYVKALLTFDSRPMFGSVDEVDMEPIYEAIGIASRCVDLLINSPAKIPLITLKSSEYYYESVPKIPRFSKLLENPSSEMDSLTFYRKIYADLVFKGASLLYDTGLELQHVPSFSYENGRFVAGKHILDARDCIFINLLAPNTEIFAKPYIKRITKELEIIRSMLKFQDLYFKNNGIPGVVLKASRPLSERLKKKYLDDFKDMLSIIHGRAGAPYILDDGMDLRELQHSFKELQFQESIKNLGEAIAANLGIPYTLISAGNNANVRVNAELFYHTTVADFVETVASAFTRHAKLKYPSDYKEAIIKPDFSDVALLKRDFTNTANSIRSLYATGMITKNEARKILKFPPADNGDSFLIPANIAGSNLDPSQGGRPQEDI